MREEMQKKKESELEKNNCSNSEGSIKGDNEIMNKDNAGKSDCLSNIIADKNNGNNNNIIRSFAFF